MGVIGEAIGDIIKGAQHLVLSLIAYTFLIFVLGAWFGAVYVGSEVFWWPIYALAFILVVEIITTRKK